MPLWHESGVTRFGICATVWRGGTVFGMEMTWHVSGAYANWKLTVTVEPPDPDAGVEFRDDWRKEPFSRLHLHFVDLVNLMEVGRQLEHAQGQRLSYA
jgi:hypothetical protein